MTIYFIRARRNVKIGYTGGDPNRRLRELQTGNPDRLELLAALPGSLEDEARLHDKFANYRLSGEWFTYGRRIRSLVKSLKGWNLNVPEQDESFITELWRCIPDIHRGVNECAFSSEEIAARARLIASLTSNEIRAGILRDWDECYVTQQLNAFGIPVRKRWFWDVTEGAFTYPSETQQIIRDGIVDIDLYEFFRIERGTSISGTPLSARELYRRSGKGVTDL